MKIVESSIFQRKNGLWVVQYFLEGKKKQAMKLSIKGQKLLMR